MVDGITGSTMDVMQQAVSIAMITRGAEHPHPWTERVDLHGLADVARLAAELGRGSPGLGMGGARLFTIVAEAGAGKTWLVKQALQHLLLAHQGGRQQVAVCITIQSIAFEFARQNAQRKGKEGRAAKKVARRSRLEDFGGDVLEWYVATTYAGDPASRGLLLDATALG